VANAQLVENVWAASGEVCDDDVSLNEISHDVLDHIAGPVRLVSAEARNSIFGTVGSGMASTFS
jgi:hypothetical protein